MQTLAEQSAEQLQRAKDKLDLLEEKYDEAQANDAAGQVRLSQAIGEQKKLVARLTKAHRALVRDGF